MNFLEKIVPYIGGRIVILILILACLFFVNSSILGSRGLIVQIQLKDQLSLLQSEIEIQEEQIALMENKTLRITPEYLDLDLLDELARQKLGYIHLDEVIIH
ncbi:MAG: septum formation initiator family protein [Paracoccaceae bacterium]|nr:septum formation initiator family protein [Paracoccaceae bacterium]MDE2759432.1 septum formation initiator family protein [Paracoccaceae bacterium]MDE2916034.1 septum formation initiator family protein [Paracoccaceae bacterium]MYE36498.1 septum formation initiator family protein [Paracoccaceae bacterium]MYJ87240.1 septum formation initiator family protein [Paracoccaceae bacterium]